MTSRRVLIVEDDDDIREALAGTLEDFGYDVATARHGREALERLSGGELPGVILLDIMIPVMDGFQFLAERQCDASLASIPVVVLTAFTNAIDDAVATGAVAALIKPVDVGQLLVLVNSLVAQDAS